jgi:hypothetical protein
MKLASLSIERLMVVIAIAIVSCAVLLFLRNLILGEPSGVYVAEVVTAREVTDANIPINPTSDFKQSDERIYCVVRLEGIASATMLAKWYYEGEEIAGHYFYATPRRPGIIWIKRLDNEPFRKGRYTVEISVGRTLVRTVHFQVE